jgi:ketosteroid isomerase-like protein
MNSIEDEIRDMVNRETKAWDTKDSESLVNLFHEDMVWPWPKTNNDHDPMNWEIVQGKYNYQRWKKGWQDLFDLYNLEKNERKIMKIELSNEKDGAFAVVDIDTLWKNKQTGIEMNWKGRVCKVYTRTIKGWKLIMHTGVLDYSKL